MKTNAKQLAAVRRATEVIAVREGISVEEVRREISRAILKQKSKGERTMEHFIKDERTGISYELIGDYYFPCLAPPASPNIGKYGRMRWRYLKEHRRAIYSQLVLSDKLAGHLEEIDQSANEMMERLIKDMAERQGVTERLKAENQLRWVGMMNNIRSAAEEMVLNDLIYA